MDTGTEITPNLLQAERAGMQVGSIVKIIDGFKISDAIGAIVRIRSHAPGDSVIVIAELPSGGSKTYPFSLDSAPALP
jgi:putative serine protease PepD